MADRDGEPELTFDDWLVELVPSMWELEESPISDDWSVWLCDLFDGSGPLSYDEVRVAALTHLLTLAREAAGAVLRDLERHSDLRPVVRVSVTGDEVICISLDGNFTTPSMTSMDRAGGFAEVADYFQAQLAQEIGHMWPVCPVHDFGGDPKVSDGDAVWWCREGDHPIARIGELPPP